MHSKVILKRYGSAKRAVVDKTVMSVMLMIDMAAVRPGFDAVMGKREPS